VGSMPRDEGALVSEDALEFVRFCRSRRCLRWPELYDEMCAVARRRLFRGWGFEELAEHGIEFGLFALPRLSALVTRLEGEAGSVASVAMEGVAVDATDLAASSTAA
jgi:hypothetical protein